MSGRVIPTLLALGAATLITASSSYGAGAGVPGIRPVLLVIDVQNVWLPRMSEEDRAAAPDKINEVLAFFRECDYPIVRVYHSHPEHGPEVDTESFKFPASIAVTDADPQIVKAEPSAFTGTELESMLREMDRNLVCLCGLSAAGCVLATYYGALDRGFMAVMVEGALLSSDASYTAMIEDICDSMTARELREALGEHDE